MRKIIILLMLSLVLGCKKISKEKLVCTFKDNRREDKVTIYFKNNESVNYNKISKIIVDNNQVQMYEIDNAYDEIKIVDKEVSLYVSENIDNMTKEEVKSLYENDGYKCK